MTQVMTSSSSAMTEVTTWRWRRLIMTLLTSSTRLSEYPDAASSVASWRELRRRHDARNDVKFIRDDRSHDVTMTSTHLCVMTLPDVTGSGWSQSAWMASAERHWRGCWWRSWRVWRPARWTRRCARPPATSAAPPEWNSCSRPSSTGSRCRSASATSRPPPPPTEPPPLPPPSLPATGQRRSKFRVHRTEYATGRRCRLHWRLANGSCQTYTKYSERNTSNKR